MLTHREIQHTKWISLGKLLLAYFGVSLFIRLPFFFRDYIDVDESTFILMGQSVVNGHLPFTQLWDLKPPALFYSFAALIAAFGKSFIAIRMAGTILVTLTGFFVYLITEQLSSSKTAFWAGMLCICTSSLFGSLQGVMSEHFCMFAFVPAIYLLGRFPEKGALVFLSGILLGYSVMCKMNMAYPTLLIGLLYWAVIPHFSWQKAMVQTLLLGLGVLISISVTVLPYWFSGKWDLWLRSVVFAPMAYDPHATWMHKLLPLILGFISLSLAYFFINKHRSWVVEHKAYYILLMASYVGVFFSFIDLGKVNGHYLLQLYPMLITLLCAGLSVSFRAKPAMYTVFWILLILAPMESYIEYGVLINRASKGKSLYNEEGFTIPAYFSAKHIHPKKIWFLRYHIAYWLMDAIPPTKLVTHPSNLYREELYPIIGLKSHTTQEEIDRIVNRLKPDYVVGDSYLDSTGNSGAAYLAKLILKNYLRVQVIGNAGIYKRIVKRL
ncbi:4-amino-4-deoxy-L-arabinose transferase [bacterium A37T11]|nr:4-amino-4-deoxy-L-arabinose transferase [bacterium A37T11]